MIDAHPLPGMNNPVMPGWIFRLPYQQQSVLMLSSRGPDGVRKHHPAKIVHACYRGCVFKAAYFGRELRDNERADTFMTRAELTDPVLWSKHVKDYFDHIDELPHHYHLHLMHGAQIIAYHHPRLDIRTPWEIFYLRACDDAHLNPETEAQMNARLNDWNREYWSEIDHEGADIRQDRPRNLLEEPPEGWFVEKDARTQNPNGYLVRTEDGTRKWHTDPMFKQG